jgi:hypothetical protein
MLVYVEEIKRSGRYKAVLADGAVLLKSSRQPFLDGARALLAQGIDPETVLVMARKSTGAESLRARVGDAAKLTVREDDRIGPLFVRHEPMAEEAKAALRRDRKPPAQLNRSPLGKTPPASGALVGPTALQGAIEPPLGPTGPAG